MTFLYQLILVLLSVFYRVGLCEVYTSIDQMKNTVQLEMEIIKSLLIYIQLEERKLALLNRHLQIYKKENKKALQNMKAYLENPINCYLLVKRMTVDLQQVESLMKLNNGEMIQTQLNVHKNDTYFPTIEDLDGTVTALTRLQEFYELDSTSLARGVLDGVKYSSELSASDCYVIGKRCYERGEFKHSQEWLEEAKNRSNVEDYDEGDRNLILGNLALSGYKIGNISLYINITDNLQDESDKLRKKVQCATAVQRGNDKKAKRCLHRFNILRDFEKLCKGSIVISEQIKSQLKCRYINHNNQYLRIAPFKLEEMYLEPRIVMFHNVMSDEEIEILKQLSQTRFERGLLVEQFTGEGVASEGRIGKVAWISEKYHKRVQMINRRVSHMTGLSIKTAEALQVCNYGVGGHFSTHVDYDYDPVLHKDRLVEIAEGDRIATLMYYMSDVSKGGGTVFPGLNLNIKPKKGSAAFWYNLHSNGTGDGRTVHGGCPVLVGSKWVANKWIHEREQEFLRPCRVSH